MSRRSRSHNAYQSALSADITNVATSFNVDSAAGLDEPVYLVIAPADPAKREFIKVGNVTGNAFSSVTRGLTGSSAGGQAHVAGTPVRTVPVSQWIDDIFTDIEDLETDTTNLAAADTAHFGGTDTADHPEVTTGVRGFMSAADKTKLNALDTAKQVDNGNTHNHVGGDGGQIDHAGLSNLTAGNPHTQYALDSTLDAHEADWDAHWFPIGASDHEDSPGSVGSATWNNLIQTGYTFPAAWTSGFIVIHWMFQQEFGSLASPRNWHARIKLPSGSFTPEVYQQNEDGQQWHEGMWMSTIAGSGDNIIALQGNRKEGGSSPGGLDGYLQYVQFRTG